MVKLLASEYFQLTYEKKREIVYRREFLESLNVQELITILLGEDNPYFLDLMTGCITESYEDYFCENYDLIPFIRKLSSVAPTKQILFLKIIINTIDHVKESAKKERYRAKAIEVLKRIKDPLLKAYAINYDPRGRTFSPEMACEIFGGSEEIRLWSYRAKTTEDIAANALNLLECVREYDPLYSELITFFEIFPANSDIESHHITEFLHKFLQKYQFPDKNQLLPLFSSFSKTEETLLPSVAKYRDHITHSFRVFLLGLKILMVKNEIKYRKEITMSKLDDSTVVFTWRELLCWIIAAFFHDVGYGIEKINEISKKIEENYKAFGTVNKAEFTLSESLRLFGERTIQIMQDVLMPERDEIFPEPLYPYLTLRPLFESWEKKTHGIMSAVMVLNEIDRLLTSNDDFAELYSSGAYREQWAEIFLRAALAMAIHTFPTPRPHELALERSIRYGKLNISDQFFPAFLLTLLDAVEFVDRPVFIGFKPREGPLEQDIEMTLQIACCYSCQRYKHIKLVADYNNIYLDKLVEFASNLQETLSCFVSQEWGVTLILRHNKVNSRINSSNDPRCPNEIKLVFLRAEEDEFHKFYAQQLSKDVDNNDLECYQLFWMYLNSDFNKHREQITEMFRKKDLDETDFFIKLKNLIPTKFSPQIRKFLEQQKLKRNFKRKLAENRET